MDYIDPKTGQIYDAKEWIIREWNGHVTKVKRISDAQLTFLNSLEYQLGYQPQNHANMPAYKAVKRIDRLQKLLEAKPPELF